MYQSIQLTKTTSSHKALQVTRRKTSHSLAVGFRPAFSILARRIALPLLLLTAGMMVVQPSAGQTWTATGSLNNARESHTETLLPDGKVLVVGGDSGVAIPSAELYDPATGIWNATGSLVTARSLHTATLLPNGKVLVAGGEDLEDSFASAELYDPASGTWTATGNLTYTQTRHTATLLANGKVLVAGYGAELYDAASGTWMATGSLVTARSLHRAILLPSGKVLVAGGFEEASAELYDATLGTWTVTGSLASARFGHTATLLPNGKVLVAGGFNFNSGPLTSAELYDPANGTWTPTGNMTSARYYHTATLLPNGNVLAAGGDGVLTNAELYVSSDDLALVSAASVKGPGPFVIDLPMSGASGVEDRSGGPNKKFTVVMTFDQNITSVGSASSTCGSVQSIVIDSFDPHKVNFNLVGVAHACNGSTIRTTANSISADQGGFLSSASVPTGLLLGDVNGDRLVNRLDTNEAQMHKGQRTVQQNFRNDVNANGHIERSDIQLIQQQNGTSLP